MSVERDAGEENLFADEVQGYILVK